jgi:predicted MFS family arabinose efflux permease
MPSFVRDRLTWLAYLQLGVYGYILYGIGPSIRLLRDEQDISKTLSGLHGTALALGAVLVGLIGPQVVARVGRSAASWGGLATACLGVVLFCSATALPVTLFGALVATFGGSFVVSVSSSVLADHHGVASSAAMSEAHASAAVVGLCAPLVIGGAVAIGAGWRAGLLVGVVLAAVLAIAFTRVAIPDHRAPGFHVTAPSGALPRRYWWAWSSIAFCVAVEFSMTIWTSDVLRDRVGMSEGAAAAGITALVIGMAIGRLVGGTVSLYRGLDWLIYCALAITAVGFAVFWISTAPVPALAGLVVCGLGIALHFPIGLMRALRTAEGRTDLATARSSLAVGIAVGVGPFVLGALADSFGTHTALLVVPAFLVLATLCVSRSSVTSAAGGR